MTMRATARTAAAAALTLTLLTGCLPGGDDEAKDGPSSGVVTGNPDDGAKQAGIDLANPPAPIAETTVELHSNQDIDSTKVELLELKRHENVMLATFRLTGSGRGNKNTSAFSLLGNSGFRPVFIDMKKLEKYRHVDDLTSSNTDTTAPLGEPVFMFTAFLLRRDGVTEMDLQVTGGSPVIPGVPMPQ